MPKGTAAESEPVELARLRPIFDCMGILRVGDSMPEWWFGILSTRTVVHGSGRIGRAGEKARHRVDPDELALCRALSAKAEAIGAGPMSSEGECDFHRFFICAAVGEAVPERIDEALIRERFGGTILPVATVRVQPLDEASPWWSDMMQGIRSGGQFEAQRLGLEVNAWTEQSLKVARSLAERGLTGRDDLEGEGDEADSSAVRSILRQLALNRLLTGAEFRDAAYVEIGDPDGPPAKRWPPGLEGWPTQFPRLFVGLTRGGSLAGVITYVVHT